MRARSQTGCYRCRSLGIDRRNFGSRWKTTNTRSDGQLSVSGIAKAESDIVGYTRRAEVAQSVEGIRKELEARQLGSRLNTLAATDARTEMQRSKESADQQLQSATRDKEALQAESDSFVQSWSADVSQKLSERN